MVSAATRSVVSDEEIIDELRAAWAEVSRSYARWWRAMAEVARRTNPEWETAEIAAALTVTPGTHGCALQRIASCTHSTQ